MKKFLGIDLGTNSIGWAIRNESIGEEDCQIEQHGVRIFSKGVGENKSGEFSKAAERTSFRSARRRAYRRKLRKVKLLRFLIQEKMCPLSNQDLDLWANYRKGVSFEYPQTEEFLAWVALDPYECRKMAIEGKVTPFELGRALYHVCQRRGFKSGKKEVKEGELNEEEKVAKLFKEKNSNQLLINGLYQKNLLKEAVRHRPTTEELQELAKDKKEPKIKSSRLLYEEEVRYILEKQNLPNELASNLYNAIFEQRPLKSQKHAVGKCTLEKAKTRAKLSSPTYEIFRLHQQLNNVKYWTNQDTTKRPLTAELKEKVMRLFFRKSVESFDFEEITKELNKDFKKTGVTFSTNYDTKKVTASGCPTIARLKEFCGEDWQNFVKEGAYEYKGQVKNYKITAYDIWHIWETMPDQEHKKNWAIQRLGLNDADATKFSKVQLADGYASLSEAAMKKINVFLAQGYIYSLAVFLANVETIIGTSNWNESKELIINELDDLLREDKNDGLTIAAVNATISYFFKEEHKSSGGSDYKVNADDKSVLEEKLQGQFGANTWLNMEDTKRAAIFAKALDLYETQVTEKRVPEFLKKRPLQRKIQDWLMVNFEVTETALLTLYHPSAIETYEQAKDGKLESPMISAIRNPMAMKTLHELRYLINDLIEQGHIDEDTTIIVELSRDLNDANKRKAIQNYQKKRESEHNIYRKEITEIYKIHYKMEDYKPMEKDILKYRLWVEQNEICIYTNKKIGCADLFNGKLWDFEHTLPRSRSFDDSQVNLTICDAVFNRSIKQNQTPFELYEKGICKEEEIKLRLQKWKQTIDDLQFKVNKLKRGSGNEEKAAKDSRIQRKHELQMELDYWSAKYKRFFMTEIKDGFKNSQLVDTGIITKYATLYLKSFFKRVEAVKGTATAQFRKFWGLQDKGEIKERTNHNHHLLDAIVISCMTRNRYNSLAEYYKDEEKKLKPSFKKPWKMFTEDTKKIIENVLVAHSFKDNTSVQTKKKLRKDGKVIDNQFVMGEGIRGSLHKDTLYGKIIAPSDGKEHFVKRVSIMDLKDSDVEKIVDVNIRKLVQTIGLKKAQSEGLFIPPSKIGGIATPVKKVRIFQDKMSPMPIKKHSHLSKSPNSEHKHFSYAANDENYALAIYKNGKERDFELVNLLRLAKNGADLSKILPNEKYKTNKKGNTSTLPLYTILQSGKSVLLLENEQDTINWEDKKELKERLFIVKGLSIMNLKQGHNLYVYSVISMVRHQEAKRISDLSIESGEYKLFEKKSSYRKFQHTQFFGLVEGIDFNISPSGNITKI